MRMKPILNVLGALLTLLVITMIVPILISYFSVGSDLIGLVKSSILCIFIGFPLWLFTKHKKSLNNKIIRRYGKIQLKDYISSFITSKNYEN